MIPLPTRDLRTALTAVMPCAATEDYRPSLYGVHWRALGDEITLTAADGFIIGEQTIRLGSDQQFEAWAGLVPLRGCKALLEWIKHRVTVSVYIEDEALGICEGTESLTIGLWTLSNPPDYHKVWLSTARNKTEWSGSVAHFLERPVHAFGGYSVIEVGGVSFDLALVERAIGGHAPKDHITISIGAPNDPALVDGPKWRAAIMPLARGVK